MAPAGAMAILLIVVGVLFVRDFRRSQMEHLTYLNLKSISLSLRMYANASKGEKYPPMAPYEDVWMFDVARLYPEHLSDLTVLVAPRLPDCRELLEEMKELETSTPIDWERVTRIAARGYTYLGWAVQEPKEIPRLAQERYRIAKVDYDLDIDHDEGSFYRLREGIERFFITDINNPAASANAQSEIMVLFEPPDEAVWQAGRPGSNVLFMDGHVEWVEPDSPLLSIKNLIEALTPPAR